LPVHWRELPEVAQRVADSVREQAVSVDHVRALGDVAAQCFLLELTVTSATASSLRANLDRLTRGLLAQGYGPPSADRGLVSASHAAQRTELRAQFSSVGDKAQASLHLCQWGERYPEHCQSVCVPLLPAGTASTPASSPP
jgi:hypothetical protein